MNFQTPIHSRITLPLNDCEDGEKKLDFVEGEQNSIKYRSFGFFKIFKLDGSFEVVPLSSQYVKIGRRPDMDIVIGHRFVSRHHFNFINNDGTYLIQSVALTNSTYLNNLILTRGEFYDIKPSVDIVNVMGFKFMFFERIKQEVVLSSPRNIPKKTGLFIDDRVCLHFHSTDSSHPEGPERFSSIKILFEGHTELLKRCMIYSDRRATEEELLLCHDRDYIDKVNRNKTEDTVDVFTNENTPLAASLAVGGVIEIVEKVIQEELENGFAIVRPPGHHADRNSPNGFCIYNNVAVAARIASTKYSKKVVIIDWDVHHGNGTSDILSEDDNVLFFSIHRYDEEFFYPGTGGSEDIGEGKGKGYTINIPVTYGYNNHDILHLFFRLVIPVCLEFAPDLIIISAGFDACEGDPLGECSLTPEVYGVLTALMRSVTKRIVLALEGGYNVSQTAKCCLECLKVLVGEDTPNLVSMRNPVKNRKELEGIVNEVSKNIHPYWNSVMKPLQQQQQQQKSTNQEIIIPKPPTDQQQQQQQQQSMSIEKEEEDEEDFSSLRSKGKKRKRKINNDRRNNRDEKKKEKKRMPRLSIFSNRNHPTPLKSIKNPSISSLSHFPPVSSSQKRQVSEVKKMNEENYTTTTDIRSRLRKRKRRVEMGGVSAIIDTKENTNPRRKKKRKLSHNDGVVMSEDTCLETVIIEKPRRRKRKKKRDSTFVPEINIVSQSSDTTTKKRRGRRKRRRGRN